jgi:activator of 2-hydroxyglutaryl-CoA dehydratase/predicted nucleotide-binding protein (sugar kinase/HSP70/actin superfamily)
MLRERKQDYERTGRTDSRVIFGVDVGSTTVKCVVLDGSSGEIIWSRYERHKTRQAEKTAEMIAAAESELGDFPHKSIQACITGSGAGPLADLIGARFVQEVNAVAIAVERLHPDVSSVVELGGQDAKIILFRRYPETGERQVISSMNDKCASGTGATIDKCLLRVKLPPGELRDLQFDPVRLHHVAARCGVFAETDIINLVKSGVPSAEVINSLADAIVMQNLTVLARGNTLSPKVLLLGGPNTFLPFLCESWRLRISQVWQERGLTVPDQPNEALIFAPQNAQLYAAWGAAFFGMMEPENARLYRGLDSLLDFIADGRKAHLAKGSGPPLVRSDEDLDIFKRTYQVPQSAPPRAPRGSRIRCYIGFDGGSTTSKAVLVDESSQLIAKEYLISRGNPIQDAKDILERFRTFGDNQSSELEILGFGVTGYASDVLDTALNADANIVETVAHMISAWRYCGEDVDVVCDIGGQDIKVLFLQNRAIKDFRLSNQCSAGNGMLLQAMADQFGVAIDDYAATAFRAELSPKFSYGCAVFLDADRVNFQREGYSREEIFAGLAMVLPKNIWQYVVQIPRLADLGQKYVLQGGTQRNLAAVKAQVDYIRQRVPDAEIIVHPHCGEAGAIGAALEAMRVVKRSGCSKFIGLDAAIDIAYTTRTDEATRCTFCANECPRTFIDTRTPDGATARYIAGFSCERGTAESKEQVQRIAQERRRLKEHYPNLVEHEADIVFRRHYEPDALPREGTLIEDVAIKRSLFGFGSVQRRNYRRGFRRSPPEAWTRRAKMRIGIPRVLGNFTLAPFLRAYLETLGLPSRNIVFSDETTEELWQAGAKYGSVDPCYPSKVALAHIHHLLYGRGSRKPLDYIWFPAITETPTFVRHTAANANCPVVAGTPAVVLAAFTKEKDHFEANGLEFVADIANFEIPHLLRRQLYETWGERLSVSEDESDWAVEQGWAAMNAVDADLQRRGRIHLEEAERQNGVVLLMLGRPYHNDRGLNQAVLEEFQAMGYPVLSIRSLPKDPAYLSRVFAEDLDAGEIADVFDIRNVWPENYSANSVQKVWAAQFAARHPNVAVLDLSSFKCGHDAPTYGLIDSIIGASRTPYMALHDLDANKPGGSIAIRVKTYAYALERYRKRLSCDARRLGLSPEVSAGAMSLAGGEKEIRLSYASDQQKSEVQPIIGKSADLPAASPMWRDSNPRTFNRAERCRVTILLGSLTKVHDALIESALHRLGYRAKALRCPDKESLQLGKEFTDRGQCNPAYFMIGNLLRYLMNLRDVEGLSTDEIVRDYVFVTISSCGPCRFGMYLTEYRKALRDAGFGGFRVLDINQERGPSQFADNVGIDLGAEFYITFFKAIIAADILNIMGYRTRPYEVVTGATDTVLSRAAEILHEAFAQGRSVLLALRRCRALFVKIEVDRLQSKPKVAIIGEFWAMTTEGEGNYRLQRFLESEGAECEVSPVTVWGFYNIWCAKYDIHERMMLRRRIQDAHPREYKYPVGTLLLLRVAAWLLRRSFKIYARAIGLEGYNLPSMDELASVSHRFYPNELRGGEGHLEMGEVLTTTAKEKSHLAISIKPFGCMPSSAISDGIQTIVNARHPEVNFLAVETTGDGAVNLYSRVQMALFKARGKAKAEFEAALTSRELSIEQAAKRVRRHWPLRSATHYPRHVKATTAANAVYELSPYHG